MNLLRCAGWIVLGVVIPLSISEESWAQDRKRPSGRLIRPLRQ